MQNKEHSQTLGSAIEGEPIKSWCCTFEMDEHWHLHAFKLKNFQCLELD